MIVEPLGRPPDATVPLPGSKSITNRAVLAAALADGVSTLTGVLVADDTQAMADAVEALGADVQRRGTTWTVRGAAGRPPVGQRAVEIDLLGLYRNETRMLGTDSTKLTVVDSARRLEQMAPYFESGDFRPLPVTATHSLDDAVAAYRAVADHVVGRVVIRP